MAENTINNKSLSIRVCSNGLSFCIYSPGQEQPFDYREVDVNHTISLAANLKDVLMHDDMLRQGYQRVNVLVSVPHFTTMPVVAFQKEDVRSFYELTFPKDKSAHVSYNVLRRSGIAIVFGMDRNVYQLIIDDFPRARFYASASTLIEFLSERSMLDRGKSMYVYLHEKEMTLYAFDRGRMLFVNTFDVASVNDMQYFILSVWKELLFDQVEDSLCLVSDIEDGALLLSEKIKYFLQNVSIINRNDDFKNKLTMGNGLIPYDLQTLLVCGF
ncbi:MAG: DUF3822 family protein [Bacteroidaceae bacterium]|nr:DUF3822 family protein [Bacteroidaceae bacterium]